MENRIKILILNSGSLQFIGELPKINQGSTNNYLEVYSETPLDKDYIVETSFRRSDGKTSPYLTLNDIKDENNKIKYYQLRMNSDWYTYVPGDLTLTLKVSRLIVNEESPDQKLVDEYKTANTSVYISPTADFYKPAPVTPTNYEILLDNINSTKHKVDSVISSNLVKELETGDTTTLEHTSIKYKTYDGTEHEVEIKLPEGLISEDTVDQKVVNSFLEVNPIKEIKATDTNFELSVKDYNNQVKTVKIKSDGVITQSELSDFSSDLVSFSDADTVEEIVNQVYFARRAEADEEGNIINETYITNNVEEDIHKKGFYSSNDTSSVGFTDEEGAIKFVSTDTEGKNGTLTVKPTTGEFNLTGEVEATGSIQDIVLNNKINTFSQPQVFTERIDILNSDGTYDSIKHINNKFLISSHTGSNIMNIDGDTLTAKFFGREVGYSSQINDILKKPVFVEIRVGDGQGYFSGTYTIPCNARSSFVLVEEATYTSYICVVETTSSSVSITSVVPLNDAPIIQNLTAEIVRVIKVGDL